MRTVTSLLLIFLPSVVLGASDSPYGGHTYTLALHPGQVPWDFNLYDNHHQSPVNLDLSNVERIWVDEGAPLTISAVREPNIKYLARNSGHGAEVVIDPRELSSRGDYIKPILRGGILQDTYVFQNVHYHWGEDDLDGSEHKINGQSYSLEGHMVMFKRSYGNLQQAVKHKDGVVVFTFFAEIGEPNPHLQNFIQYLPHITNFKTGVPVTGSDQFLWFLSDVGAKNTDYYAYPGSLTTPEFSECVTFIITTYPVSISHGQLQAFRNLMNDHGSNVLSNKRALQPFDKRPIAYVKNNLRVDYNYPGQSTFGHFQDYEQFGYSAEHPFNPDHLHDLAQTHNPEDVVDNSYYGEAFEPSLYF